MLAFSCRFFGQHFNLCLPLFRGDLNDDHALEADSLLNPINDFLSLKEISNRRCVIIVAASISRNLASKSDESDCLIFIFGNIFSSAFYEEIHDSCNFFVYHIFALSLETTKLPFPLDLLVSCFLQLIANKSEVEMADRNVINFSLPFVFSTLARAPITQKAFSCARNKQQNFHAHLNISTETPLSLALLRFCFHSDRIFPFNV